MHRLRTLPCLRPQQESWRSRSLCPRSPRRCVDASMRRLQTRQEGHSHHLAIGPSCSPCYSRRRRNPEPCSLCGVTRVRGGLNDDGGKTCGPGCGTDIDFSCRRCGTPGDILGDGRCLQGGASDRVHNLLADEDGQVTPRSLRLPKPPPQPLVPGMFWRGSAAARAPASWPRCPPATGKSPTHSSMTCPRTRPRATSATFRCTPAAHRDQSAHRPFAEWFVIRDARRRADRGRRSLNAATGDGNEIRPAA